MNIDRDELRKLADAATPGPWEAAEDEAWGEVYSALSIQPVQESWDSDPAHACCEALEPADAEFIAAAREAVPSLLDELDQLQAAHRDALSHARRIIAHPDRWIAQDLVDATSNMLSALKGAPTIKGGAVQWKQAADEAEARSKALAEDVAHIDALYDQAVSRIQAVEHLLDKTDSMFVGAISAEHRAILISKVRRALDVP